MRIPDSKIDEVRSASDIVDVISSCVRLKKRGKNFVGLCPFHQEKTPSFNVSPDKQMYYCFGCGNGGNVITFVSQLEKVSFIEAVRTL
ncbi:MAG: dnaG, partial [Bacteroidetes bacterium]|nr:dnaG [Bacteroidota bacterium]